MTLRKYVAIAAALGLGRLCAAAQIGNPAITPASTQVGVAATVTISALILDQTVIASTVNLQQLDGQGRIVKVVGTLVDDGTNGDATLGDRVFSIRFTVFAQNPGSQTYRVSAGVLGSVTRIFSSPVNFSVTGSAPTGIAITQPSNLTFTNISPLTITGTVGDPGATVQVNGITATRSGATFQASVPLQEGNNPVTAVAANTNNTSSTAAIQVTLDTTPPHVTVDSPSAGFVTTEQSITVTGLVNDLVVGTVNNQQATVTVNGTAARVANRRYVLENVSLSMGANNIQVVARDRTGNSATASATVTRQAPAQQSIKLISGNNQAGTVGQPLAAPLVVQLLNGSAPAPNIPVIFKITENDGVLLPGNGRQQLITVNTDAQGQARATLTLGHRSGAGNNTIQASAAGFQGVAVFSASGNPQAAAKIVVDSGNNQFGPIGQALVFPLVAVVTDAANNRLSGVGVTFAVSQGGGSIGGQTTAPATTDGDGRALVVLTLGLTAGQDNNVVEATFAGNPNPPAVFTASAKTPGNPAQTSISGIVVDNSSVPIAGVTMRLFQANQGINNNQPVQIGTPIPTDAQGFFRIAPAPVGLFKLMADGSTATQSGKSYPTLEYDIVTVAGQDNGIGMPIFLPTLDPAGTLCVNSTTGGELKPVNSPGFSLKIQPGAATFPGGGKSGCVSVSPVNPDKMPMSPAFGQQPQFVVTIQPVGTIFNPPAAVTIPNLEGLAPNSKTEMFSYDHDLSTFVSIGSATVSADGSVIASDPGVGVLKAGWFDGSPPAPVPFTIDPIGVKVGSAPAGCIVPPSSAKAPAPAADTCDVNFLPGGQNFMTVNLKVGETRTFVARGSTAGTYTWLSNVPDGTKVTQTPVQFIASVKALKPGRSNIAVFFTAATPDANGVRHVADAHIDIIAYKVASLSITPTGDQTLAKPPGSNVFEIDKAFDVSLKLTANGEANDVPAAQNIQLSFDDPDDPTISFVIDPNGGSGDDNASIAAGGRRTGVMWKDDADPSRVSSVSASSDGQKALAFLFCKLEQVCTFPVTFRASTIAGDNYIIKADALTFSEGGDTLFDGVQAKSGTWTVRRKISIAHLFEMQNSVSTTHVMSSDEIAPAFTGDGFTDYIQSPDIRILTAADSPHFLCDIDSPDASETPTQDELTRYNSTDPSIKATAKRQIEDKATNWVDRNQQRCISTKADFAARFVPPGTGISVFGIQKLSPKEDADPATGQTNFYPDGILVSVSLDGATAQVDPDGEWSTSPVLIDHDNQLIFIQAVEANEHLRNLLRRAVALTYLDRADFDDTTTGVLGPGAPTGTIDDVNILRLRGYIKLP